MKNFYMIDTYVSRSARPDKADLRTLFKKGVRTIISLEEGWADIFGWKKEPQEWRRLGGTWIQVKLSNIFAPTKGQLDAIMFLIEENSRTARVHFHCLTGKDRTGFVAAYYEVKHEFITPQQAWDLCCARGMHWHYRLFWKKAFFDLWGKK